MGSAITRLALPLLAAITLNATPTQMGLLVAAESTPILIFGLATGVWVDRRAKRPVMIVADVGRAMLLVLVPVAAWLGFLGIELLLLIAFLVGALLGGILAEPIGLRGVMIVSALGGPFAFLAIWFSPVRTLAAPPERMEE